MLEKANFELPPFLILQLRPEPEAADSEYAAILHKAGLTPAQTHRIRLDVEPLPANLNLQSYGGIIVGGGPGCVSDAPSAKTPTEAKIEAAVLSLMPEVIAQDIPFLGCCYGIGILGHHLARAVSKAHYSEPAGTSHCSLTEAGRADALTKDLPEHFDAFVGHKEALQTLPEGCAHLISSPTCPYQMIRYKQNIYATQFHPEADAREFATRIHIYKHKGYFPPEEADSLIEMVHAANVYAPERVLRNFVERYRRG
ncbi:MAG: glutamine amidotransferase [Rhodobacteraceae bacterium]|nr:glutamine amidotransferase [Paracoccaceae bacterium]